MSEALEIIRGQEKLPVADARQGKLTRVVIVGAGFAGMAAARALSKCDAEIVLIDRQNHHIFQPLLNQVATAVLAPLNRSVPP
jgi:NADH dehydrogenase